METEDDNVSLNESHVEGDVEDDDYNESEELFWEEEGCEFERLATVDYVGNSCHEIQEIYQNGNELKTSNQLKKQDNLPIKEKEAKSSNELALRNVEKCGDEFDVFGHNIAELMRLLKNQKHIQLELKCKIIRAIMLANELMNQSK